MTYLRNTRACSKYMRFKNVTDTQALFVMALTGVPGKHTPNHREREGEIERERQK